PTRRPAAATDASSCTRRDLAEPKDGSCLAISPIFTPQLRASHSLPSETCPSLPPSRREKDAAREAKNSDRPPPLDGSGDARPKTPITPSSRGEAVKKSGWIRPSVRPAVESPRFLLSPFPSISAAEI